MESKAEETIEENIVTGDQVVHTDNGILEFMSVDRAIELYKQISCNGPPDLDWKFYGRRKPDEPGMFKEDNDTNEETHKTKESDQPSETIQTEFDFDEEFNDTKTDDSLANESLQLKKRPEVGSERKTNLSDIMSDIMKESQTEGE